MVSVIAVVTLIILNSTFGLERADIEDLYSANRSVKKRGDWVMTDDVIFKKVEHDPYQEKRAKRKAVRRPADLWPNNTIPYKMDAGLFTPKEEKIIKRAMQEWEDGTCLRFRPSCEKESLCLVFKRNQGCRSRPGRIIRENQYISLEKRCLTYRTVLHELGHVVGLHHEQNRPDRDDYITVHTENILKKYLQNFDKETWEKVSNYSVPYDFYSIMHYSSMAFSKNYKKTITTKENGKYDDIIGMLRTLSFGDLKQVNIMYNCAPFCGKKCPEEGFLDKNCNCVCRGTNPRINQLEDCNNRAVPYTTTKPPLTTPTPEWCNDDPSVSNDYCSDKKFDGYCAYKSTSYFVMVNKCRKTCKLCHHCIDYKYYCKSRAASGWCTKPDRRWDMLKFCKKSCGFCNLPCEDHATYCKDLAGWCSHPAYKDNRDLMATCPKTCGYCPGLPFRPQPRIRQPDGCKDNSKINCATKAQTGQCFTEYYDMIKDCRRSCNFCNPCMDIIPNCANIPKKKCSDGSNIKDICKAYCGNCT